MLANPEVAKFIERYGIIAVVAVMMLALTILKPDVFLGVTNLTNIVKQNASAALLALGMFVVILTAGIDLSVGSVMALAMVSLAVANRAGYSWETILLIGPLVGIAAGWVNGAGLTWLRCRIRSS
jgi:ribose/xylose/arabinose/galactoside ABC-type transport system permease subunit